MTVLWILKWFCLIICLKHVFFFTWFPQYFLPFRCVCVLNGPGIEQCFLLLILYRLSVWRVEIVMMNYESVTEKHFDSLCFREDWKPVLTINSIIYGLQYLFLVSSAYVSWMSNHCASCWLVFPKLGDTILETKLHDVWGSRRFV